MKRKLINICGTARSGSTMVDLMLGNDSHAFSLGEVHAWFRPFRTHHFNIICSCGQDHCPWKKLKTLREDEFHKKCFEILNVDILVDSSKKLTWVIDNNIWAKKNGYDVSNVLLYKEPVSFFYSYWKRGISINRARRDIFTKYYRRFFEANMPFIALDYNKLVEDPASILEDLCQSLGVSYFEGKERFWEKEHHHLFGSRSARRQVETKNSAIWNKEDYPLEFQNIIPEIETDNMHDKEFQYVLSKLSVHEMMASVNSSNNHICKPYWYYLAKYKQKIKKRFPEKWEYDQ